MTRKEFIDNAIKNHDLEALEGMLEAHHYSTALDGKADTRALTHIGARPCKLSDSELGKIRDAVKTLESDWEHAEDAWLRVSEDPENTDPETIMLSTGYADVFVDGDVISGGETLFNVS